MSYLLGIDVGTSGTKALLCDERGRVKGTATSLYPLKSPKPGWFEQDPQDWWKGVCAATKQLLKQAKVKPYEVLGIGLSGQMHGSVFLGDGRKPLRPALLWNDQRTAAECQEIEQAAGGRAELIKLVANPALTGFTAPKILWVRKHEPKVYAKTKKILLPKDYVRYCMTAEYATEVSDASGTLLLDVVNRKWSNTLLGKLKIDRDLMPECYESPDVTGVLTKQAATEMGLVPGIPVVGGAGDVAAAGLGMGIVGAGIASATIGTSAVMFAHADKPVLDPLGRVHTMCHAVPGKWCVFGCMLSGGGSFQWARETVGEVEAAAAAKSGKSAYDLMTALAAKAPAGGEGLFFLPYLTGERCPHPDPLARGAFIGITRRTTRAMLVRSVLEGVTFGMRDGVEIMKQMGLKLAKTRATGGGAKSKLWLQLQADIFNQEMVLTNSTEGGCFGVALLAGVGAGVWSSIEQAADATIRQTTSIKPNKSAARAYDKHYEVYTQLYPALKGIYPAMASLA
jgi:xylulokinase